MIKSIAKILIIEDDEFLRGLISRRLAKEGFGVLEAAEGREGWKKIQEESVDLILLESILPGMDGFELLEQIKKDPNFKNIPVIIISDFGQEEEIKKGLELGAADYIVKASPTSNEIISKIKKALGLGKTE